MMYVITVAKYDKVGKEFKLTKELYVENYDNKPDIGDMVITKNDKKFIVRATVHKSHDMSAELGKSPTTELIVTDDDLFLN